MADKIDYKWYRGHLDNWFFNLDVAVINALNLLAGVTIPKVDFSRFKRPLVFGSGNAYETGRILYEDKFAIFADESRYEHVLDSIRRGLLKEADGAVLISASGTKDAPGIAKALKVSGLERVLLTCNPDAPAAEFFDREDVHLFPSVPEPYTYNTSAYMGMILAKTGEQPAQIQRFIREQVAPVIPGNFGRPKAYCLHIDGKFSLAEKMLATKFIELFARNFGRDVFTREYVKEHATNVVGTEGELVISLSQSAQENAQTDGSRLDIPLPENANYAAVMAIGYYVIGKIQEQRKPVFRDSVVNWCEERRRSPLVNYNS